MLTIAGVSMELKKTVSITKQKPSCRMSACGFNRAGVGNGIPNEKQIALDNTIYCVMNIHNNKMLFVCFLQRGFDGLPCNAIPDGEPVR